MTAPDSDNNEDDGDDEDDDDDDDDGNYANCFPIPTQDDCRRKIVSPILIQTAL